MSTTETSRRDPLERTEELYALLQGVVPEDGYVIPEDHVPRLGADQAWTVIWYLQNQYWTPPDHIERCGVCGELYDSESEGAYFEGVDPHHFCDACYEDTRPDKVDDRTA